MAEAKGLNCGYCGAPIAMPDAGNVVQCTYCERQLVVEGQQARRTAAMPAATVADTLLRGYGGQDHGRGQRYGVAAMEQRDWRCPEYGIWPISGRASSQYGTLWSAAAIVGSPQVYPRCGDIARAWAPGTRESHTEWIEATYPPGAPPARAIRVFETCMPGATYAVAIRDGADEEVIWERPAVLTGKEAQVLEIELSPPRRIGVLRAYVSNTLGDWWSEIDTIGLVATEPVPLAMRAPPAPIPAHVPPGATGLGCPALVAVGLVLLVGGIVVAIALKETPSDGDDEPETVAVASTLSPPSTAPPTAMPRPDPRRDTPTPMVPEPAEQVSGTTVRSEVVTLLALGALRPVWATAVVSVSSQYSTTDCHGRQALLAPDVYPRHGDIPQAWAPYRPDQGWEWIAVSFPKPVLAQAVLLIETFNPGAVVRVDDVSNEQKPVLLWKGQTSGADASQVTRLDLRRPRTMSAIRVVLNTTHRAGWNEIDAIGLVPR